MAIKLPNETRWENLQKTSDEYDSKTEAEIKEMANGQSFYEAAAWLAYNRTKFIPTELLEIINSLEVLDVSIEKDLWDELFYQVVTQESFYIKELLMQLLILNNAIRQTNAEETEPAKLEHLSTLANARVVLPKALFEKEIPDDPKLPDPDPTPDPAGIRAVNIAEAQANIAALETARKGDRAIRKKISKRIQGKL
jgi:hypothetical protein